MRKVENSILGVLDFHALYQDYIKALVVVAAFKESLSILCPVCICQAATCEYAFLNGIPSITIDKKVYSLFSGMVQPEDVSSISVISLHLLG